MDVTSHRLAHLDGLRGIAVLLVLFGHASNLGVPVFPWVDFTSAGGVGVYLFFVLSAFLLTSKLDAVGLSPASLAAYARARIARIYPLYAVVVIAHAAAGTFSANDAVAHLLMIRGDREFWALPPEVTYYAVIPLLVWFHARQGRRLAVTLPIIAAVAFAACVLPPSWESASYLLGPFLSLFLAGSAAALVLDRSPRPNTIAALAAIAAAVALMPSVLNAVLGRVPGYPIHSPAFGIVWAFIILQSLGLPWLKSALSVRPLVYVGRISFSLYLLHMPILYWLKASTLHPALVGAAMVAASIVAATVTYRVIERPGMALGRSPASIRT